MSFREDIATQAAGVLLRREGNRMNYTKLLKLLYLADRKSLLEATKTISGDTPISMDNGPLLSSTYDLIKASANGREDGYWCRHIRTEGFEVTATADIDAQDLSDADEGRLNEIYDEFGGMSEFELIQWTHEKLPEWKNPHGSSQEIPTREIFFGAKIEGSKSFGKEIPEDVVAAKERRLHQAFEYEKTVGI